MKSLGRIAKVLALTTALSGCNGKLTSESQNENPSPEVVQILDTTQAVAMDVPLDLEIEESFEVQESSLFEALMKSRLDVNLDDLGSLLSVDSIELQNYLSLLVNSGTGLEKLFERRILNRTIFENYMNIAPRISEKCENLSRDPDRNIARDCFRILNHVQNQQPGSQRESISSYFDADYQESEAFVTGSERLGRVNTTLMPSVYSDRTLGLTIMLSESFPGPPGVQFSTVAREAIALLMLDNGFNPNFNINTSARLVGGPWHLYYSTFRGLSSGRQDNFVSDIAEHYKNMMIEPEYPFFSMAENSELATIAYEALMLDNLNRLENLTVYNREFTEEQKQKFDELFNNPANHELFIILALYFHKTGGSINTMNNVVEQITLNDFDVPRIIEAIGSFDSTDGNSEYARRGLILYRELNQSRFFVDNF